MVAFRGGERLEAALRDMAQRVSRPAALRVGFFEGATYPDKNHTPVAAVAAFNEFGTSRSPSRPFFRRMIRLGEPHWPEDLARYLQHTDYDVVRAMELMGEQMKGELVQSITDQVYAPLAKSTVARKGFDTTLLETAHMKNSADAEVKT